MPKSTKATQQEIEYIGRVAGKVPLKFMAEFLGRSKWFVCTYATKQGLTTRVPQDILEKHWPDYCR